MSKIDASPIFTGMRYKEILSLKENSIGFDPSRKMIKVFPGKKHQYIQKGLFV